MLIGFFPESQKMVEDETGTSDSPRDEVFLQLVGIESEPVRSMGNHFFSPLADSIPQNRTYILYSCRFQYTIFRHFLGSSWMVFISLI